MPRGDSTGPQGQGPMTGRGRGNCNPKNRASRQKGKVGMQSGRKVGRGRGAGRSAGSGAGQGRGGRS